MQQSSKGNPKENFEVDEPDESPSAFSVCSKDKKIKRPSSGKRDSGYGTDNSGFSKCVFLDSRLFCIVFDWIFLICAGVVLYFIFKTCFLKYVIQ